MKPSSGSAGGNLRDEGARQLALRVRRRFVRASVRHMLSFVRMRDFAVQLAVESEVKHSNSLERDRYLLCSTVAEAFGATLTRGVSESDL